MNMMSELQRLVDSIGDRLERSVAIDDRRIRLLAYNSYAGTVDTVRVESIMRREVPRKLVRHLSGLGIFEEKDVFTVPKKPELGVTVERIGMPVRFDGGLLGFIWLLGSDGPVTTDEVEVLRQGAERAAYILQRDHLLNELRRARVRDLLRDLLSDDPRVHHDAAGRLVEEELLVDGSVTSLVVTIPHESGERLGEKERLALTIGLEQSCGRAPPRTAVHLERVDHGVIVVTHPAKQAMPEIDDLARIVQQRVTAATGCSPSECYVGIGRCGPALVDAYGSYVEARRTAEVARAVDTLGTITRFSRLGVYGLLVELPTDRARHSIHPGLHRLLEHDVETVLTNTLEVFLTNAGDVRGTAADLNLHRTSVHYRLRRIEQIADVDLANGEDRLALHVSLKVARLIKLI